MKSAFIIERLSYYRIVAPIIDEALRRGWHVECWHDYSQPRSGTKGYQFPSVESAPTFANGLPIFKPYVGVTELRRWLLQNTVDVVVSLHSPALYFGSAPPGPIPRWVGVQHSSDFFTNNGPQGVLSCDAVALYSDWWIHWAREYFEELRLIQPGDSFERRLQEKAVAVGFPELDQSAQIDPGDVRARWGIPHSQPVVVLLPFPGAISASFWARRIHLEPNPLKQALAILSCRRFTYWAQVFRRQHDLNVLRAIRRFCDRNDAYLLIKSRLKTPVPRYAAALADKVLYDECYYPATILETLRIASLCIGFLSAAVLEAVALGVPSLWITFSGDDYYCRETQRPYLIHFAQMFHAREGGLFQFQGASTTMSIPEALATLADKRLDDFTMDPQARERYVTAFLGDDDQQSAWRVVDLACRVVRQRVAAEEPT